MSRNDRDPTLEGHILETLRWLLWFTVLLVGIGSLAFLFARPLGPNDDTSRSTPPSAVEVSIPLGSPTAPP